MTYRPDHLGMTKAQAARIRLSQLNADTDVRALTADIMDDEQLPMVINALKLRPTTDLIREEKNRGSEEDESDTDEKYGDSSDDGMKDASKHVDMVFCAIQDELCRLKINSICLGLDVPLVAVKCDEGAVGGEVQFSMPGHTACLQCWGLPPSLLRSQSMINMGNEKVSGSGNASNLRSPVSPTVCLPLFLSFHPIHPM